MARRSSRRRPADTAGEARMPTANVVQRVGNVHTLGRSPATPPRRRSRSRSPRPTSTSTTRSWPTSSSHVAAGRITCRSSPTSRSTSLREDTSAPRSSRWPSSAPSRQSARTSDRTPRAVWIRGCQANIPGRVMRTSRFAWMSSEPRAPGHSNPTLEPTRAQALPSRSRRSTVQVVGRASR